MTGKYLDDFVKKYEEWKTAEQIVEAFKKDPESPSIDEAVRELAVEDLGEDAVPRFDGNTPPKQVRAVLDDACLRRRENAEKYVERNLESLVSGKNMPDFLLTFAPLEDKKYEKLAKLHKEYHSKQIVLEGLKSDDEKERENAMKALHADRKRILEYVIEEYEKTKPKEQGMTKEQKENAIGALLYAGWFNHNTAITMYAKEAKEVRDKLSADSGLKQYIAECYKSSKNRASFYNFLYASAKKEEE